MTLGSYSLILLNIDITTGYASPFMLCVLETENTKKQLKAFLIENTFSSIELSFDAPVSVLECLESLFFSLLTKKSFFLSILRLTHSLINILLKMRHFKILN